MAGGGQRGVVRERVNEYELCAHRGDDLFCTGLSARGSPLERAQEKWRAVIQLWVGVFEGEAFLSAQWMPAKRVEAFWQGEHGLDDGALAGAQVQEDARVGHQAGQLLEQGQNGRDGSSQDHDVCLRQDFGRVGIRQRDDLLAQNQLTGGRVRVDAKDGSALPLKGQRQRAAHQAQSDYRNFCILQKKAILVAHGNPYTAEALATGARRRSTASAIALTCLTRLAKTSGLSDWRASETAWAGSLWTSMISPPAPAAIAAPPMPVHKFEEP